MRLVRKVTDKLRDYGIKAYNFLLLLMKRFPNVINSQSSVDQIIARKLSVSRFGDGELMIICGSGWGFQEYDAKLAQRLAEVLRSDNPDIAICIPDVFRDRSRFTPVARKFWYNHLLETLHHWNKYTLPGKIYMDTQFTRFYMDLSDKERFPKSMVALLRKIWENDDILIVEGAGSRLGYKNDLFSNSKSISRILCPPENAFSKYSEILEISRKNAVGKLVLIALGMTATILAYDLACNGFRALDIGHVDIEYEWFLMKAVKKVPVKHRYMNEVSVRDFDEIDDSTFLDQIIGRVK